MRSKKPSSGSGEQQLAADVAGRREISSQRLDAGSRAPGGRAIQPIAAPMATAMAHLMSRLRSSTRCSISDMRPVVGRRRRSRFRPSGSGRSARGAVGGIDGGRRRRRLGRRGRPRGPVVAGRTSVTASSVARGGLAAFGVARGAHRAALGLLGVGRLSTRRSPSRSCDLVLEAAGDLADLRHHVAERAHGLRAAAAGPITMSATRRMTRSSGPPAC